MSGRVVEDLSSAARFLDEAYLSTRNAVVLLDRVSNSLTEDALQALQVLEETRDRVRSAVHTLESV